MRRRLDREDRVDVEIAAGLRGVEHPVDDEDHLQLADRRALEPDHAVDPRGVLRLRGEGGVGDVLAAGEADDAVDDEDLAVVAQIDPREHHAHEIDRQRRDHLHAALPKVAAGGAAQESLRAHRVDEHAARDAPGRRPCEGVRHAATGRVVEPDVEEPVGVVLRRVDRGDHRADGVLGLAEEFDAVAAADEAVRHRLGEPRELPRRFIELRRIGRRVRVAMDRRLVDAGEDLAVATDAAAAEAGLADGEVEDRADHRLGQHQHDPAGRDGGAARLADEHDEHHHEAEQVLRREVDDRGHGAREHDRAQAHGAVVSSGGSSRERRTVSPRSRRSDSGPRRGADRPAPSRRRGPS